MTAGTLCRSERIARFNDRARQTMGLACVAVATEGFRALSDEDQSRVREQEHRRVRREQRERRDGDHGEVHRAHRPLGTHEARHR